MESSKNVQDVNAFDWDDSDLIKAYEKGMKIKEKALGKGKLGASYKERDQSFRADKLQKYKVGSHCRALYSDKQYYEAKIISIDDEFCTVEFLGYGDTSVVNLKNLKDSFGKKARKKQIKKARFGYSDYSTAESDTCGETTDEAASSNYCNQRKKLQQSHPEVTYDYSTAESTFHAPYNSAPSMPAAMHSMQPLPQNAPFLPPPPAPPMPHCGTSNPSVSAMLVSWYMAGYYTGLHQAQKGCQRCSCHSNQCCHH